MSGGAGSPDSTPRAGLEDETGSAPLGFRLSGRLRRARQAAARLPAAAAGWLVVVSFYAIGWLMAATGHYHNGLLRLLVWFNSLPGAMAPPVESPLVTALFLNALQVLGYLLCVLVSIPLLPLTHAFSRGAALGEWYFLCRGAGVDYGGFLVRVLIPHGLISLPAFLYLQVCSINAMIWARRRDPDGTLLSRGRSALKRVAPIALLTLLLLLPASLLQTGGPAERWADYVRERQGPIVPRRIGAAAGRLSCIEPDRLYLRESRGISFESHEPYRLVRVDRDGGTRILVFHSETRPRISLSITDPGQLFTQDMAIAAAAGVANVVERHPGWRSHAPPLEPTWPRQVRYIRHATYSRGRRSVRSAVLVLPVDGRWVTLSSVHQPQGEAAALCELARVAQTIRIAR